jgi:hypothetical protein
MEDQDRGPHPISVSRFSDATASEYYRNAPIDAWPSRPLSP